MSRKVIWSMLVVFSHLAVPEIPVMASSSSSATQKNYAFDVFFSFRGEDTRMDFIDHLCVAFEFQGIRVFKDDEDLLKGGRINDELLKTIEDSKIHIIVLSKNYASSSWCMDELAKIMECQKEKATGHIAYPVFLDVEPREVRKQLGPFGEAFSKHINKPEFEKWRQALEEVANLAGWDLRNTDDGHKSKLIKRIVDHISLELRFTNVKVDERLVGMESRITHIVKSLEMDVEDVRMIGIRGIGGGGKTTLASAVFDNISFSFEVKSFIENVREVSTPSMSGLRLLQEQLLSSVSNKRSFTIGSVHEGKDIIKKRLSNKKVILVLDDVNHLDQLDVLAGGLNWFGPGSRIIITTRDERVLVAHGVKSIHDVNLLSQEEGMRLFSKYAFGSHIPIQTYYELSLKVVCYAAGLPLTLKVLGSSLCGKDELVWEDTIERLRTIPLKETLAMLELSYTDLEDDHKEMFLDVACFLKGWVKEDAIRALQSCGFHARSGLKILEQRSLITVFSLDQRLGMHDHIQQMGLNIIYRSYPGDCIRHSRLWIRREIECAMVIRLGQYGRSFVLSRIEDLLSDQVVRFDAISRDEKRNLFSNIFTKGCGNMKKLRFPRVYCDVACDPKNCVGVKVLEFTHKLRYLYEATQELCLPKNETRPESRPKNKTQLPLWTCFPLKGVDPKECPTEWFPVTVEGPKIRDIVYFSGYYEKLP